MGLYNIKVTEYETETQVTFYDYSISKGVEKDAKADKQYTLSDKQSTKDSEQNNDIINKEIENKNRSIRRSKQGIYEIARANNWEWFATFTFKDERYNYARCKDRLSMWLRNTKRRYCNELEWLCVPEMHKDGAYHFHALINGNIKPIIANKGWNEYKYTFTKYNYGISELERVKDANRVSMYITKYISKDMLRDIANARRYFYSKGVKKPTVKEFYCKDNIVNFLDANFPNKDISYVSNTFYKNYNIQYVQLKEKN